ncbi:hypothetical protein KGP84_22730 [Burkholderia multivorans]|uniref:hypothetical protein n=1 Tax=Burkholderia cepacia complex TaxID=87882 RepID=UPI00084650D9|nr:MULTISPECIES: hypothetical protein [Burkholderia cepacia complex]MCO8552965.1 hypothetical protein [Burkholderia multivorans]
MDLTDRLRGKQKNYFILELCTEQELNKLASHYDSSLVMLPTDNLPQAYKDSMKAIKDIREEQNLDLYFNVGKHTANHEQIKIGLMKNGKTVFSGVYDDPLKMIDSTFEGIRHLQTSNRYQNIVKSLGDQATLQQRKKMKL